ncbi:HD domain-containing phosphohydrolase [Cellvibrio sp. PSBB006]|uniref:HD domain-containing phosphohydrolase n=1 Tax=Cellvibrio sp. PSBB006 TaxID=1987723 RepID=UPI000B3B4E61|nr:HD domain-containing phosphohydrolase [Cellvibrio sp. PSBB006]ARU29676.1 two-component system response regulator [Cellvibrio sp. PSBB006]
MTTDFSITILVVDDETTNLNVLRQILKQHYRLLFAKSPEKALELAETELPDLILLDVMMPQMNGYQVCERLKQNILTQHIPVIFVSALSDAAEEAQGFAVGGVDYITKPVSGAIVRARVATHLSLVQVDELKKTRLEIVQRLGLAAEYKDNETGLHVIRMSHYSHIIARAAGFDEARAEDLLHAAPMHDIGKIGIPDCILQKPGKLTPEEWAIMREHPVIGARIIGVHTIGLLHMAHDIALTHHERWDGSGYPRGLQGEDIPVVGRIVAVADVFDALTTQRPYKKAWPLNEAIAYIREQRGKHFDPRLVEVFLEQLPAVLEVKERWAEKI